MKNGGKKVPGNRLINTSNRNVYTCALADMSKCVPTSVAHSRVHGEESKHRQSRPRHGPAKEHRVAMTVGAATAPAAPWTASTQTRAKAAGHRRTETE